MSIGWYSYREQMLRRIEKNEPGIKDIYRWDNDRMKEEVVKIHTYTQRTPHTARFILMFWNYTNINYQVERDLCVLSEVKLSNTHQIWYVQSVDVLNFVFTIWLAACGSSVGGNGNGCDVRRSSNRLMITRYQRHILIKIDMYSIERTHTISPWL